MSDIPEMAKELARAIKLEDYEAAQVICQEMHKEIRRLSSQNDDYEGIEEYAYKLEESLMNHDYITSGAYAGGMGGIAGKIDRINSEKNLEAYIYASDILDDVFVKHMVTQPIFN